MRTFKLTLAYDGTDYAGWQRQASAETVQACLEGVLAEIEGRDVTVHGAGRTDAGVHALGQVASVQLKHSIAQDALHRALNAKLPEAIRVQAVEVVGDRFHARFDALAKSYRYRIDRGAVASPFERRYAWHLAGALDEHAMAAGAQVLIGTHDFAAFQTAASDSIASSTVRTLRQVRVRPERDTMLTVEVTGDGFLRYMVRTIVGTLVEIGRGRRPASDMPVILASRRRDDAGPTAPPQGLFLVSVEYPKP